MGKNFQKYFCLLLILGISCVVFTSCGNKNTRLGQNSGVYVVGTEEINGENFITLWKNGTPKRFSIGTNVNLISSATMSDNGDVYAAGSENINGVRTATLWKNGVAQPLGESNNQITSVSLSGNDVYVVASGKLWKNGVAQNLNSDGFLYSVWVEGNNVYAAGNTSNTEKLYPVKNVEILVPHYTTLWENGIAQNLTDGIDGIINDFINEYSKGWTKSHYNKIYCDPSPDCIYVSGNNVYVGGSVFFNSLDYAALIWENGKMKYRLEGGGSTFSIYVSGDNVYAVGYKDDNSIMNRAMLWVNGNATSLSNKTSNTQSVFVSDNKVYVAGAESVNGNMVATLWVNGEVQHLTDNEGSAFYVCVK